MIKNFTNLIRENNNYCCGKKKKMFQDAPSQRCAGTRIFNLTTNISQFFSFQAGVFLALDSPAGVICKHIALLFPVPLSLIYHISIGE